MTLSEGRVVSDVNMKTQVADLVDSRDLLLVPVTRFRCLATMNTEQRVLSDRLMTVVQHMYRLLTAFTNGFLFNLDVQ